MGGTPAGSTHHGSRGSQQTRIKLDSGAGKTTITATRFSFSLLGAGALLLPLALIFAGCGKDDDPVPNRNPFVRITGGPLNGVRASYTASVYWSAWDEDGVITHFEYALDPPLAFSREEIAAPENRPDISVRRIFGPDQFTDTLRVSKTLDGTLHTFDWVQTRAFTRSFAFTTPNPDSSSKGGSRQPDPTFNGVHAVYVRAQDDDEAYSDVDEIGYTAVTITPQSSIVRPDVGQEITNLGAVLTVAWDGLDPDSPAADKRPVGYLYRLLRLDTLVPPISIIQVGSPAILYTKGEGGWTYQDADTQFTAINLATPGQYLFGVRAVDQAGAVEPFLQFGRNAFKFQAFPQGGRPLLTLSEPGVGTFTFRGQTLTSTVEVPTNKVFRFRWTASAQDYGGTLEAFSYGLDIPDLEQEGPDSGWSPWGLQYTADPFSFSTAGIHVFYVRARDVAGSITLATIIMRVVEFSFDRDLLFFDDSYDDTYPRDAEHDDFWRSRLNAYPEFAGKPVFEFHAHGPLDRGSSTPAVPPLEELGRYRLIVWENRGSGYNGVSSLFKMAGAKPTLAGFLGAGGQLWLGGRMTVGATVPAPGGQLADLIYPKELLPGMFAYDILKLQSSRINNDRGVTVKNNISRAIPFPGRPEIYPEMNVDRSKLNPFQTAPGFADAVFDPLFAHADPNFKGTIDSLYTYGATGQIVLGSVSNYHNRLTGIRWHDPDPDREQGRIQWFGFPMYYFEDSEVQVTVNRSLDWFREELPPSGDPEAASQ